MNWNFRYLSWLRQYTTGICCICANTCTFHYILRHIVFLPPPRKNTMRGKPLGNKYIVLHITVPVTSVRISTPSASASVAGEDPLHCWALDPDWSAHPYDPARAQRYAQALSCRYYSAPSSERSIATEWTVYYCKSVQHLLKVIRKFFFKHNKSFRWHLGDYEKHNFFPFEGLWEEKLWFLCVLHGCVVCPAGVCGPAWRRRSVHAAYINRFLTGSLTTRKNTQKSKFLLSQNLKWKKIMFFVIPEMPSKTFVMV